MNIGYMLAYVTNVEAIAIMLFYRLQQHSAMMYKKKHKNFYAFETKV